MTKVALSVLSSITIMLQIPYVKLGLDEDINEFANDALSQLVIVFDIIYILAAGTISYLLSPGNTDIFSYVFHAMAAFRSIGYFVVAYDYMQ